MLEMFYFDPSAGQMAVNIWGLLPFSRGNVTIVVRVAFFTSLCL